LAASLQLALALASMIERGVGDLDDLGCALVIALFFFYAVFLQGTREKRND
jgi:hypothetical protein